MACLLYTSPDERAVEACHKLEYVEYLNDLLLMSDQEERTDTVKEQIVQILHIFQLVASFREPLIRLVDVYKRQLLYKSLLPQSVREWHK